MLINLSPFMRYDGYYVLSDWLETPNLHARSFALARWWIRETLLGLGDAPPEDLPIPRRRLLVFFAFLTWLYRFSLFLGIAAVIFHFAVKVVGIAMMVVEMGYFLVRPIASELLTWWRRRADIRLSPRTLLSAAGAAAYRRSHSGAVALGHRGAGAAQEPAAYRRLRPRIRRPRRRHQGRGRRDGGQGRADGPVHLARHRLQDRAGAAQNSTSSNGRWAHKGLDKDLLAHSRVTEREYEAQLAEYRGLADQKARLEVTTPMAGKVVDLEDGLAVGMWVKPKSRLASVIDSSGVTVEAYVDEADLDRVAVGRHRDIPCRGRQPHRSAVARHRDRQRQHARFARCLLWRRSMAARSRCGPRSRTNWFRIEPSIG